MISDLEVFNSELPNDPVDVGTFKNKVPDNPADLKAFKNSLRTGNAS